MTSQLFIYLLQFSTVASVLVAGVFLTFSDFVMRSLDGAEPGAGIEVMQIINREVFRTVFMVLLIGMSALSPVLFGLAYQTLSGLPALYVMFGAAFYFVGTFAVTVGFNVPMNVRLDGLDHTTSDASAYWSKTYFPDWTFWNYVRAIAAAIAGYCFLAAQNHLIVAI